MPAVVYTELFKNIPLLAIIFLTYFGLASSGIRLDVFTAGCAQPDRLLRRLSVRDLPLGDQRRPRRPAGGGRGARAEPARDFAHVVFPQALRWRCPAPTRCWSTCSSRTSLLVTISAAELMSAGPADRLRDLPRAGGLPRHLGPVLRALLPAVAGAAVVRAPDPRRRAADARRRAGCDRPRAARRARTDAVPAGASRPSPSPRQAYPPLRRPASPDPAVASTGLSKSFDGRRVLDDVASTSRAARSSAHRLRAAAARRRCCAASTCSSARPRRHRGGRRAGLRRPADGLPRPRAAAPHGRHGLPAVQPLPAPDRRRERHARADKAGVPEQQALERAVPAAAPGRPRPPRPRAPRPDVRR